MRTLRVGIVGHGDDKFTNSGREQALAVIRSILSAPEVTHVVSGHSPVGGVDIFAEEIGRELGLGLDIKSPRDQSWNGVYGYRARNLDIAKGSDIVHVILADAYPAGYKGRRFEICYHCAKAGRAQDHVKSGACWTALRAVEMGTPVEWHVVANSPVGVTG